MIVMEYDPGSIAWQRVRAAREVKVRSLWAMYGHTAFGIVTDDATAIALGSLALRRGRSGAEVARMLADYLALQEARAAKARKDARNARDRARRARKKAQDG